ncbi:acyl-CoA dehydrogenase family protein [Hoeflea prorocentri]|uniref:Acyl-[acyl-carrier-protein] dehydrogenase MbtN n=1 Tax=Hoeflea prorocentri TaxID=1922333 RepID=A0A9X3UFD8_9HYPH|nr:acyl-CoA dehydrogenase family protein [Hoeflea prorocentri]MCY6379706.1 acyl-CoA dehydrogenase family protein [Hoeflea prorocentri]MDA5397506.1 acyl-CoA dehydrogenase family protein [Hoeflea prorocentri]
MFKRTVFSDEHEMFRDQVRRFVEEEIRPYHDQWEKDGRVSRQAWLKAGENGLLCAAMPEEYGGAGADFLFSMVVMEELARAGAMGPGFSLHSDIVAPYLLYYGTEELKKEWLPKMARGEAIGALGMTEPGAGSDVQGIKTTAIRDGDDFVINGQKVFITNGGNCDLIVLACKTDPAEGAKGTSLILVPSDTPGFRKGNKLLEKVGWKAQDTAELFFDNVRVPITNLLGQDGRGFYQMMEQLPQERLLQCVRAVANLEAALEWTIEHVRERKAFGRTIADFQNTRFKLAEVKAEAVMLRVFVDKCLEMHLAGELDSVDAAMGKMLTSEMLCQRLDDLLQLHGGYGYMWEYPIARAWADARVGRIAGGTGEIMREIIGRSILGGSR